MDNTNYALALREAYNEKASLMNEFSSEQARKEAITNVTGEVDIPSGIALVQSSIKSDAGKAILKNFLKKTTGIDEETASDFIDNVAENGLHGLMNSDIATQIKDRASEFLNPSDGESTILKLRNLFMNGKEEGLDALTKIAPNNLSELKQRVYDEGKERLESLRTEKNNKVSELKNKIKDLQEQAENETDNDRLSEIENNINDLKQQGRDIVSKYKDELSDNKAELENRMNDIQDSINKKADDLVNDFNDSIESLKNNVGERFSNINNTVSKYIGKRKLEINPTENYEEGDENLIGNIKNFFSNLISKGKDTVKPLVEQKYEMAMELRDKVNNIKIPRDLEDQINETQSQLDNISDQYRNITTSEEQADIINNMRDLQDKLDDLQDKKNDLIDKATYKIKNKLQKKYNLREEEEDDDIYEGMEPHEIEATFREQLQNEPNIDELVSSSGNRYMSLLQNPEQIMGQDSSIARAINSSANTINRTYQTASETASRINTNLNPQTTVPKHEEPELEHQMQGETETENVNETENPSSVESAETTTDDVAENVGKTVAENVGEDVGELAGEEVAEESLNFLLPGLGLLIGLGTLGGQIGATIKEATDKPHIHSVNPSFQAGI